MLYPYFPKKCKNKGMEVRLSNQILGSYLNIVLRDSSVMEKPVPQEEGILIITTLCHKVGSP
jgi:hypothetical protein